MLQKQMPMCSIRIASQEATCRLPNSRCWTIIRGMILKQLNTKLNELLWGSYYRVFICMQLFLQNIYQTATFFFLKKNASTKTATKNSSFWLCFVPLKTLTPRFRCLGKRKKGRKNTSEYLLFHLDGIIF